MFIHGNLDGKFLPDRQFCDACLDAGSGYYQFQMTIEKIIILPYHVMLLVLASRVLAINTDNLKLVHLTAGRIKVFPVLSNLGEKISI